MSVESALTSASRLVTRRLPALLPYYLLVVAAADVARLPLFVAAGLAYLHLDALGRVDPVAEELLALNPERLEPAGTALPSTLETALDGLVTPTVVALFGVAVALSVVLFVLARAVATAGALAAVDAGLRGGDPIPAGVAGVAAHWRTFVGVAAVRWGLLALAVLPGFGGALAATRLGPGAALAAVAGGGLSVLLVLVVTLGFAFVGPAIVVDDVGVRGAVRNSLGVPRHRPGEFILYVLAVIAVGVATGVASGGFALVGTPRVATLLSALVVAPLFDGLAVALYAAYPPLPATGRPVIRGRLGDALREGVGALATFLRTHPGAVVAGTGTLVAGIGLGWTATAGYGAAIAIPGDPESVFGAVPVGPFVNIAANNWLVAGTGALSGLGLGLPTAGTLLFNGILVGAIAGVVERTTFLALVAPHGVVELPAIGVAGGVGFHLGRVTLRALGGRASVEEVSTELRRTEAILVGLGIVFVVAAFIEAFVTPRVAAAVLG